MVVSRQRRMEIAEKRRAALEQVEEMVPVFNGTGKHQTYGLFRLFAGEWTSVPKSLAESLACVDGYTVDGARKRPSTGGMPLRSTPHATIDPLACCRRVDIVIPVHNALDRLKECVLSIRANVRNCNVVIVNDGSKPDVATWLKGQDFDAVVTHEEPQGFGKSCNAGLLRTSSPWVCVLNSDTLIAPHAMSVMQSVGALGFGIVGPTTSNSSGIQCDHELAQRRFKMVQAQVNKVGYDRCRQFLVEYEETDVFGFCMLISQDVINTIGGFDWVRYGDGYYEDWDFVWRAQQAGFKSAWAKGAYVHHYGTASFEERLGWPEIHRLSDRNKVHFDARIKSNAGLFFDLSKGIISGTGSSR